MNRSLEKSLLAAREKRAPAVYKHKLDASQFKRFTWKERLKILFGYNVRCNVAFLTEQGPGRVSLDIKHTVVKAVDPDSAIKEEVGI